MLSPPTLEDVNFKGRKGKSSNVNIYFSEILVDVRKCLRTPTDAPIIRVFFSCAHFSLLHIQAWTDLAKK